MTRIPRASASATLARQRHTRPAPRAVRREALRTRIAAIDLGGTKVVAAGVDERGRIRVKLEEPVDNSSSSSPIDQIVRMVRSIAARPPFGAAGVAVPGLVRRDGTVWAPNLPGWDAVPLARTLRRRLGIPVVVESDRNAAALGEAWRGAARGRRDVVVLMLGTGIGAGILSGGRLVRGAHELSGCAGWLAISGEQTADAARFGGLEAHAAGPGIARAAGMANAQEVAAAARAGDPNARKAFSAAGRQLGIAVANIISLFDPETVVLTGGLAAAADLFLDVIERTVLERAQPLSARQVAITVSDLGHDANLLGVARLALSGLEREFDER